MRERPRGGIPRRPALCRPCPRPARAPDLTNPATHALMATRMTGRRRQRFPAASRARPSACCSASRASSSVCSRRQRHGPGRRTDGALGSRSAFRIVAGGDGFRERAGRPARPIVRPHGDRAPGPARLVPRHRAGGAPGDRPAHAAGAAGRPRHARRGGAAGLEREPAGGARGGQRAALPAHAARVIIMSVGNGPEPEPSADELAGALAWHGIAAEARRIEQGSRACATFCCPKPRRWPPTS